jgi:hypothetical protein
MRRFNDFFQILHDINRTIIITTIISGITALSEPQPSLEDSARFVLNYAIRVSLLWTSQQYFFLQSKTIFIALNPINLDTRAYKTP